MKLSVSLSANGTVERVRVANGDPEKYSVLSPVADEEVVLTRRGRETTAYPEHKSSAERLSAFEAEQLRKVVESLAVTLEGFERDLAREHWGRVHYLDTYLLRFMTGFYYLCDAVTCSNNRLSRAARVPEAAFDVSTMSPKTDKRVAKWRATPEHVVKLRICAKSLCRELRSWQKDSEADYQQFFDTDLQRAYAVFVRTYLGLPKPPKGYFVLRADSR